MKQIIGANRRSVSQIEMQLPIDINGEYAFDENGKPIKGVTPVVLVVPRFDCIPRDQLKTINKELKAVEDLKDDDGDALTPQDKSIEVLVTMLRPFASEDEVRVVRLLKPIESEQIAEYWQEQSTISLGELLASTNS